MFSDKKTQDATPLLDAVSRFIDTNPAYFRIPGHRLSKGISPRWTDKVGTDIFSYDVTETPLTDDLHCPQGAIQEAQELLSRLYGADRSFFLVNGSTCGNEAMILSAALEGEKIMVARNAHKSAMMGLVLSGASPVYVMPGLIPEWSIQGALTPGAVKDCFEKNPGCKALFIVSPSYYGICADLRAIADICHQHNALLLVDEAHGGHLYFHENLPTGALEAGADICVQSLHKVAGALTQSSVLHVKSHGIHDEALERIAENLHLVQSTSPNYLLMASLDCARYELAIHGTGMMQKALTLASYAGNKIQDIPGFQCMNYTASPVTKTIQFPKNTDMTRLIISAKKLGLTGFDLDRLLFEKYAVNMELSDPENVLAVVTYANEQEDMDRLIHACTDISKTYMQNHKNTLSESGSFTDFPLFPELPPQAMTPRKAFFTPTKTVRWQDAAGKISGQMIAPYPPGIPVIYPGELITGEIWNCIERFRREHRHMHGTGRDGKLEYIKIIKN